MSEPKKNDDPSMDPLNAYIEQLHRGQRPDRGQFLREHPDLESALECYEALHAMSPTVEGQDPAADNSAKTTPGPYDMPTVDASGKPRPGRTIPEEVVRQMQQLDLGQYELIEPVGRGGMGVVFRARQKGLDRQVAVKLIPEMLATDERRLERFKTEAKAAAGVLHDHVVTVHDAGTAYGHHYFVMQFVEGSSLDRRLKQGPFEPDEAASLLATVARAVDHLHKQGIVHCDLKPSNILLDEAGKPLVTDFGLARVFSGEGEEQVNGDIAGTPLYMSPEQAAGKNQEVGPLSDVYSLGVILYEMLTGKRPFEGETALDTLVQVKEREPPLPRRVKKGIPRELEIICLKCLAKSRVNRYESAGDLAEDLEHYLRREPLPIVTPPGVFERVSRWLRRNPPLGMRLGALGVFYAAEWVNFLLGVSEPWFHWSVSLVLAIWVAASFIFQQLLSFPRCAMLARFGWCATDTVLLLAVLLLGNGFGSPAVICFPLLIIASGLWFQVRLVWFQTLLSVAAYVTLMVDHYGGWSVPLDNRLIDEKADRPAYFLVALALCGCLVAYQVWRVRTLTQYAERRRLR